MCSMQQKWIIMQHDGPNHLGLWSTRRVQLQLAGRRFRRQLPLQVMAWLAARVRCSHCAPLGSQLLPHSGCCSGPGAVETTYMMSGGGMHGTYVADMQLINGTVLKHLQVQCPRWNTCSKNVLLITRHRHISHILPPARPAVAMTCWDTNLAGLQVEGAVVGCKAACTVAANCTAFTMPANTSSSCTLMQPPLTMAQSGSNHSSTAVSGVKQVRFILLCFVYVCSSLLLAVPAVAAPCHPRRARFSNSQRTGELEQRAVRRLRVLQI